MARDAAISEIGINGLKGCVSYRRICSLVYCMDNMKSLRCLRSTGLDLLNLTFSFYYRIVRLSNEHKGYEG